MALHMDRGGLVESVDFEGLCPGSTFSFPISMWDRKFWDKEVCIGTQVFGDTSFTGRMGFGFSRNFHTSRSNTCMNPEIAYPNIHIS